MVRPRQKLVEPDWSKSNADVWAEVSPPDLTAVTKSLLEKIPKRPARRFAAQSPKT